MDDMFMGFGSGMTSAERNKLYEILNQMSPEDLAALSQFATWDDRASLASSDANTEFPEVSTVRNNIAVAPGPLGYFNTAMKRRQGDATIQSLIGEKKGAVDIILGLLRSIGGGGEADGATPYTYDPSYDWKGPDFSAPGLGMSPETQIPMAGPYYGENEPTLTPEAPQNTIVAPIAGKKEPEKKKKVRPQGGW